MDSYSLFIKIVFWFAFGLIFFVKSGEPGGMPIMFCIENNSQNELLNYLKFTNTRQSKFNTNF